MIGHLKIYIVILSFFICSTPALAGQNLSNTSERIAIKEYFLDELADFMFEKSFDAKRAFKCISFSSSASPKGDNNIVCDNKKSGSLTIETHGSGSEKSSIRVCKKGYSNDKAYLRANSFDQKPAESSYGQVGTMHQMGRTNGWFRDYENIYMESSNSGEKFSCWSILRR